MKSSYVIIGLIALFGLVIWLLMAPYYRPHTKTVEVGLQGQAKMNRFLAMQRFLESKESNVQSKRKLTTSLFSDSSDTIVASLESLPDSPKVQERMEAWVRDGGILITGVSSKTPVQQEWPKYWMRLFGIQNLQGEAYDEIYYDLQDLEIEVEDEEGAKVSTDNEKETSNKEKIEEKASESEPAFVEVVIEGEKFEVDNFLLYEITPRQSYDMEVIYNLNDEVWMTIRELGNGGILFVGNMNVFENNQIDKFDHANLLDYLDDNWFGYDLRIVYHTHSLSLLKAIWNHIPLSILGLALFILMVCIHTFYRFGPLDIKEELNERRSLREHLEASASFYQRHFSKKKKNITTSTNSTETTKAESK